MAQHKDRFESAMAQATATENLFAGTAGALAAIGDLNTMWTDLAKVSPEEITTDVETVRDYWSSSYDKAADNVSNPLGGLSSALLGGFKVAGPMQRVNDYTAQQCPEVGAPFLQTGA